MLIPNHPHDERLSALASGDPEVLADAALSEHVASCVRCTQTVAELQTLRASLAELPDLQPHRPLQLLPPVEDTPSRADALGGWARRFFAPMLTAGAALALVGMVGTVAPSLGGMAASGGADSGAQLREAAEPAASDDRALVGQGEYSAPSAEPDSVSANDNGEDGEPAAEPLTSESGERVDETSGADNQRLALTEDRPIWPMLLFAGVALMIAAALLRWILAPRAG